MSNQPFRYDWLASVERITEAGLTPASVCLYCLPEAGRLLLLASIDRLKWKATYRIDGVDVDDTTWNEIQDIVDSTEVALDTNCDELIGSIVTQVTSNVTTIINNQTMQINTLQDACCYLEDQPLQDGPPSSEPPPPTSEDRDYLCSAAQAAHQGMFQFLQDVFDMAEALGGLSAAIIAELLALAALSLPLVLLGIVIAAVIAFVADSITDDVILAWNGLKYPIACCFVNSVSAEEAKDCIDNAINEDGLSNDAMKTLFKAMWNIGMVNKVWNHDVDTAGHPATFCDDCVPTLEGIEYWAISWQVVDYVSDAVDPEKAGIHWGGGDVGQGGTGGDFVGDEAFATGGLDGNTFAIVAPTLYPAWCPSGVSLCTGGGKGDGDPVTDMFIPLGIAVDEDCHVTARFTNFRLLVKSAAGLYSWHPAIVTGISASPPHGFTYDSGDLLVDDDYTDDGGGGFLSYTTRVFVALEE